MLISGRNKSELYVMKKIIIFLVAGLIIGCKKEPKSQIVNPIQKTFYGQAERVSVTIDDNTIGTNHALFAYIRYKSYDTSIIDTVILPGCKYTFKEDTEIIINANVYTDKDYQFTLKANQDTLIIIQCK